MKKVKNIKDILADPRIERVIKDYDGYGKHMVECKKGFRFEANNSTIEIGNIKEICYEVNERLEKEINN
jgi:hypothetical protein